jgi:hypothetical protein
VAPGIFKVFVYKDKDIDRIKNLIYTLYNNISFTTIYIDEKWGKE